MKIVAETLFVFVLNICIATVVVAKDFIVRTNYGKVRGELKEYNGTEFSAFYGIPYAAPPVGNLRFKPPRNHHGWGKSIREAKEYGPACPQRAGITQQFYAGFPANLSNPDQDEDCLFVDVFTTGDMSKSGVHRNLLPVIVFIHGGNFVIGFSRIQSPEVFVTDAEPVVMVTIQYRLGILGFVTSGNRIIAGNMGLKDQNFALKWVQRNIAKFGGDPKRVTISGNSVGGESVLAHMISPMSRGLFQKAIAQSSPASWFYPRRRALRKNFDAFALSLGCHGNTFQATRCLRTKPWQEIVHTNVTTELLTQRVIDGKFIVDAPKKLWKRGAYNNADLIIGFTKNDGNIIIEQFLGMINFTSDRSRDLETLMGLTFILLQYHLADEKDLTQFENITRYGRTLANWHELHTILKEYYYDTPNTEFDKALGIFECSQNGYIGMFSLFVANQVARNGGHVYVYQFDRPTAQLSPNDLSVAAGADHGTDSIYLFGRGFLFPSEIALTSAELTLTHSMTQAWTSFVNGNPSFLTTSGEKVAWQKYTTDNPTLLIFDTDMSENSTRPDSRLQDNLQLWLGLEVLATWI